MAYNFDNQLAKHCIVLFITVIHLADPEGFPHFPLNPPFQKIIYS
jgi:hypothetical protein